MTSELAYPLQITPAVPWTLSAPHCEAKGAQRYAGSPCHVLRPEANRAFAAGVAGVTGVGEGCLTPNTAVLLRLSPGNSAGSAS